MGEVLSIARDRRCCLNCGSRCAKAYHNEKHYRLLDLDSIAVDYFRCPRCDSVEVRALYVEGPPPFSVDGTLADLSHRLWSVSRDV